MNPAPARSFEQLAARVKILYESVADGVFPELALRRLQQEAKTLISKGGAAALDGYILMGVAAPLEADRDSFTRYFNMAEQLDGDNPITWLNEAYFAPNVGMLARAASIVQARWETMPDDLSILTRLHEIAIQCFMVETAPMLQNRIEKLGANTIAAASIDEGIRQRLQLAGFTENDLVARAQVAADAAWRILKRCMIGFSIIGDGQMGFGYQFLVNAPVDELVEANVAIAEAVTSTFDDDLSSIVTFSVTPFESPVNAS